MISITLYIFIFYYQNKTYFKDKLDSLVNNIVLGQTAPRGRIFDVNGNVLVDNKQINNLVFHYTNDIDTLSVSKKLASLISLASPSDEAIIKYYKLLNNENDLLTNKEKRLYKERKIDNKTKEELINKRIIASSDYDEDTLNVISIYDLLNTGYKYTPKIIIKDISDELINKILSKNIEGITIESSFVRYYPYGNVLKEIFGIVGSIPEENKEEYLSKGYTLDDEVGLSYLEKYYDDYLKGTKATYKVNSDNSLTKLTEEVRGNDLYLSIDINKQIEIEKIVENNLKLAKNYYATDYLTDSYAILSSPSTGAIIAIVGKRYLSNNEFNDIITGNITSSFTLGSVVKGASLSVGFKYNLFDPYKKVKDSCVKLKNLTQKCSWDDLGYVDAISALAKSSNYYQFLIAMKLAGYDYTYNMDMNVTHQEFKIYRDMFASYGLGIKTGIDLPNEQIGLIGNKVSADLLLNLAIGQYDTYTPIEVSTYINTLATKERKSPSLVSYIKDIDNNVIYQNNYEVVDTIDINDEQINIIREGFKKVMEIGGTGWGSFNRNLKPAGKTGTSESFLDTNNDGKIDTETISLTVAGYFPYDNPKYSLVVISPHASYQNNKDYTYYVSAKIARDITNTFINS